MFKQSTILLKLDSGKISFFKTVTQLTSESITDLGPSPNKRVGDSCLMPSEQFFSHIMTRTSRILMRSALTWNNTLTETEKKSIGRHVTPFGHNILIKSQPIFALTP